MKLFLSRKILWRRDVSEGSPANLLQKSHYFAPRIIIQVGIRGAMVAAPITDHAPLMGSQVIWIFICKVRQRGLIPANDALRNIMRNLGNIFTGKLKEIGGEPRLVTAEQLRQTLLPQISVIVPSSQARQYEPVDTSRTAQFPAQ